MNKAVIENKIENKNVIKKERTTKSQKIKVKFIIPVFDNGTLYERNKVYLISREEAEQYKGDYIQCL